MGTRYVALLTLLLAGCTSGEEAAGEAELTREQKDSVIAESSIPGSQGVRKAIDAREAAQDRMSQLDSIQP
ncbi:MAG: hypothetical protein ABFS14_07965 [Gemmatimonadota bacterium]